MAATIKQGLSNWQKDGEAATAALQYSQGFSYEHYTQQYVSLYARLLGGA